MKLRFNGVLEKKSGKGCNCKRSTSSYSLVRSKMYILPSGKTKTFYAGSVAEVSDADGEFLLRSNGEREVFTKVGD